MTDSGLPSLLMQAARSAAEADGVAPPPEDEMDGNKKDLDLISSAGASALEKARAAIAAAHGSAPESTGRKSNNNAGGGMAGGGGKKKGPPLRRGKWTAEEEAYANRLIQEFKAGLLPLTDGTTLRTFLSKLLNCDPMRISKKFVGNNCIGKQVFRRRTADLNRLTPEQIQQSRAELSELERRFLERVAQTNRVKSSGVGAPAGASAPPAEGATNPVGKPKDDTSDTSPPSPPWLQPPAGYKQGNGAAMANGGGDNRAAAAGRALLEGLGADTIKSLLERKPSSSGLSSHGSAGLLAMAELQRQASRQNLLQNALNSRSSAGSLLEAAAAGGSSSGLSGPAMAQIVRNASAARLAGLTAAGNSVNNLMLKTGLSRDQLTQLARDQGLSSASLGNMIDRQNSFDALMSLDFQSLQSIDNLANLIQTGGALQGRAPENGLKNWSADSALGNSQSDLAAAVAAAAAANSSNNLASNLKRLASSGGLEIDNLLRTLSGGNMGGGRSNSNSNSGGGGSSANLSNLLQSLQGNLNGLGGSGNSAASLLGSGDAASAISLANLLRADSSTGLTALRMQDGLSQRNSSVDDFLSLVASGDIPHQDPTLLNVPLMQQQNSNQNDNNNNNSAAAQLLAHQQLLARVGSNSILANALASRSLSNLMSGGSASLLNPSSSTAALALAQQQARAAAAEDSRSLSNLVNSGSASLLNPSSSSAALALAQQQQQQQQQGRGDGAESPTSTLKRKLRELESSLLNGQGNPKR